MNIESKRKPVLALAAATVAACCASANPIVWLHGWNSDGTLWKELQEEMVKNRDASPDDFLTLSYYRDGLGFSTDSPIEEVAAAVARKIVDFHESRGGESVDVVCHSMGGLVFRSLVAQECLADPSIVRRYVTLGTPHYGQNAELSYQAKQMTYGSDFLWHLGEAWHFEGLGWPASDTLCIAGMSESHLSGETKNGSYWDGLVHAWSAALGSGVPTRYVYRCHSSILLNMKAKAMCSVADGSNDAVYRMIRDFLADGTLPALAVPTYGGKNDNWNNMTGWVFKERSMWSLFIRAISADGCVPFSYPKDQKFLYYEIDGKAISSESIEHGSDATSGYPEGLAQVFGTLPTGGVHRVAVQRPNGTWYGLQEAIQPAPGSCRLVRAFDGAEPTIRAADADGTVSVPLSWLASSGLVANANCLSACTNALTGATANGYTGAACWRYGLDPQDAEARVWIPAEGIALADGRVRLEFGDDENAARVHVQRASSPVGPFAEVDDADASRAAGELSLDADPLAAAAFFRLYRR